jgi:hypothetical protein
VFVLRPERRMVQEYGGVDQRIREREMVRQSGACGRGQAASRTIKRQTRP